MINLLSALPAGVPDYYVSGHISQVPTALDVLANGPMNCLSYCTLLDLIFHHSNRGGWISWRRKG
jgi:hypothetical protein